MIDKNSANIQARVAVHSSARSFKTGPAEGGMFSYVTLQLSRNEKRIERQITDICTNLVKPCEDQDLEKVIQNMVM